MQKVLHHFLNHIQSFFFFGGGGWSLSLKERGPNNWMNVALSTYLSPDEPQATWSPSVLAWDDPAWPRVPNIPPSPRFGQLGDSLIHAVTVAPLVQVSGCVRHEGLPDHEVSSAHWFDPASNVSPLLSCEEMNGNYIPVHHDMMRQMNDCSPVRVMQHKVK